MASSSTTKPRDNGALSTIEVINLLLGVGNDHLDIQGTIDPDVPVKLTGTVIITAHGLGAHPGNLPMTTDDLWVDHAGIDLTRPEPERLVRRIAIRTED